MKGKTKKKIDDAKLRRLWVSRMSDCDISRQMGHHRSTLRRRAEKLGLPPRREGWARTP